MTSVYISNPASALCTELPLLLEEPENVTAVVGEQVLLRCSVPETWPGQQSPPRVLWHARRTGRVHPGKTNAVLLQTRSVTFIHFACLYYHLFYEHDLVKAKNTRSFRLLCHEWLHRQCV